MGFSPDTAPLDPPENDLQVGATPFGIPGGVADCGSLAALSGIPCNLEANLSAPRDPSLRIIIGNETKIGAREGGLLFEHGSDRALLINDRGNPRLALPGPLARSLTGRDPKREDALLLERFLKGLGANGSYHDCPLPAGNKGVFRASGEGPDFGPKDCGPLGIVTLEGLGLGHLAAMLVALPGCVGVTALEASPAIAAACLWVSDLRDCLASGALRIVCGKDVSGFRNVGTHTIRRPYVTRFFTDSYKPLQERAMECAGVRQTALADGLLGGPPTVEHARDAQEAGVAPLPPLPGVTPVPGRPASSPTPAGSLKKRRLLFFKSGYYLDPELRRASVALGHHTGSWGIEDFKDQSKDRGNDYRRLLEKIKSFRPDMVVTVNHLGFDTDGLLSSILARLGIPAASWFVDSPWYILGAARLAPYPGLTAFSWDSDYLGVLKGLGFPRAYHLPLATDEGVFARKPAKGPTTRDIGFVGDSLEAATGKYLMLAGLRRDALAKVDRLARDFLSDRHALVPDPGPSFKGLGKAEALNLSALVTWRASRLWRRDVLQAMPKDRLTIAGDAAWAGLVPGAALQGQVGYYTGLRGFYQGTKVNLNITSAQMKGGLNQRVFDVPASGSFLLTDKRGQLDGIFREGTEVATYGDPEEARELALFYLTHEPAREGMAKRAREKVLGAHLYRHRLPKLVEMTLGG
ncbi:MAG: glycosyltransferase [Deltaproteobacteria bacterium]|jgi:spore maturation protein CgeB|nr:glycosyltransferase [Deltaproteobacteria bacterium]